MLWVFSKRECRKLSRFVVTQTRLLCDRIRKHQVVASVGCSLVTVGKKSRLKSRRHSLSLITVAGGQRGFYHRKHLFLIRPTIKETCTRYHVHCHEVHYCDRPFLTPGS